MQTMTATDARDMTIAKIVSQAGIDAALAAKLLATDPGWANELVAEYDRIAAETGAWLREETPDQVLAIRAAEMEHDAELREYMRTA